MNQKNSWRNKTEVQKANVGEKIIREYLENKGWVVYEPITEGKHGFDKLAVLNKKTVMIAEVKTKARMNKYPATGFDMRHLEEYKYISEKHRMPIFIFFVDEGIGKIYGNFLDELMKDRKVKGKKYPWEAPWGCIMFPLIAMIIIADLKNDEIETLKQYSTRKYDYKFIKK